jgi:hypothetical protein
MATSTTPTVIARGILHAATNHGSIVSLSIQKFKEDRRGRRTADGVHVQHCDHRMGRTIWEDLQQQWVEVIEDAEGTVAIREAL